MSQDYALSNPLSLLLDKDRKDFTMTDLLKVILEKKIERLTFHYTALDGKLKELKLPIANPYQAERILTNGERVDGSSLFTGLVDVSLSDLYVVPVYKTAFLNPFDKSSLDFICRYLTETGELAGFTLDSVLQNSYHFFHEKTGLDIYGLGELEFFLLSNLDTTAYPAKKQSGYHSAGPFSKSGQIMNEMIRSITQITGAVKYAHREAGYIKSVRSNLEEIKGKQAEQLEIEFLPTPLDETADNLVLARWLIRNISYKHGCVATFAPKIEEGIAGNGLHVHIALMKNGHNIMIDSSGKLSDHSMQLIGGLCTYADSLMAFGNTVSSAYLRLVPNQEAPTRICWSDLNRSAMIRVPLGWSETTHLAREINPQQKQKIEKSEGLQTVELRTPDGSAIVHLILAGISMAAEWGITHPESIKIAQKYYVKGNIFKNKKLLRSLPPLPRSCVESAKILLRKRDLYERENIFPPSIINYTAALLKKEDDLTMNQTLSDLPADDRLHETRKIMHMGLHRF